MNTCAYVYTKVKVKVKVKVKLSHDRPEQAVRTTIGTGSENFSDHGGGKDVSSTHRPSLAIGDTACIHFS
jgi:hypothetical protein